VNLKQVKTENQPLTSVGGLVSSTGLFILDFIIRIEFDSVLFDIFFRVF